jgi:hypothetical protein
LPPAIIALGVGAIGIGAGIATGVMATSEIDDVKSRCIDNHCRPEDEEQTDDAHLVADVSTAMFVIGGVGLAAGITLSIWQPGGDTGETATLHVSPGGLHIKGRF